MPFVAIDKNTGERIVATQLSDPRSVVKDRLLQCQLCGGQMFLRGGSKIAFHFYHASGCHSSYSTNPETPQHLAGKSFVAEEFLPIMHEYATFPAEFEVPVPEVMRVADVLISFPIGWRIVHEIQLSPIGVTDLAKRTNDYLAAGIDVLWWFGKGADTPTNREWAIKRYHFSLSLIFDGDSVASYGCWKDDVSTDRYGHKSKFQKFYSNNELSSSNEPVLLTTLATWWTDHAFARYFQVWKRGNNDMFRRGLGAAKRTLSSFNGKIGAGRAGLEKNQWCHKKIVDGVEVWVVVLDKYLPKAVKYDIAVKLSLPAIQIIKDRAKKNSERVVNLHKY